MPDIIEIDNNSFELYISEFDIRKRVNELASAISIDYKDRNPIFIGVLNGAVIFLSDLVRGLAIGCEIDFIQLSSYEGKKTSSGSPVLLKDVTAKIAGRDIIVVEDIVDSGLSIAFIKKLIEDKDPASVRFASLLIKKGLPKINFPIDYIGFEIPPEFVIGYGLDYAQKVRNLKNIYKLVSKQHKA